MIPGFEDETVAAAGKTTLGGLAMMLLFKVVMRFRDDLRVDRAGKASEDVYLKMIETLQENASAMDRTIHDMNARLTGMDEQLGKEMTARRVAERAAHEAEAAADALRARVATAEQAAADANVKADRLRARVTTLEEEIKLLRGEPS